MWPTCCSKAGRQIQHDLIQQIANNPNLDTWQYKALALATAQWLQKQRLLAQSQRLHRAGDLELCCPPAGTLRLRLSVTSLGGPFNLLVFTKISNRLMLTWRGSG
jgi:hypothetical protein